MKKKKVLSDNERLDLIIEAIIYCKKVMNMGMPSSCYSKALREPIFFLWEKRGGGNKYDLAEYRTKKSIGVPRGKRLLIRDHTVPYRYVQSLLLNLKEVNRASVRKVLEKYLCACVITTEEDSILRSKGLGSKMPENWNGKDKMARYLAAGIEYEKNYSKQ